MVVRELEESVGIVRLRKPIHKTNRLAALRMRKSVYRSAVLRMIAVGLIGLVWCAGAWGTTYYVSSREGNDSNNGTSSSSAWQTLAKVNTQTLQPGDSVLLRRGDVWNESLIPSSSGTAANPITFEAYGSGPAPNLTGYYAVPSTAWALVTGNAWKAPLPAIFSTVNFCLFGSVWGQKVGPSVVNLHGQWDFYQANGYLYVYSVGSPANYYSGPIVPMALSNVPVINVNGKSWLTFQHILINWFDQYGVYVTGASDHLVFANMEADSMIPQGTQPLGFYVNESSPGPGDIKIYNSEANLNYDGFRFDGGATAITMVNDKGYANRDAALADNTGAVTYSYCHFYASSLAVAGSTDVLATTGNGAIAGVANIPADTAPAVQVWQRYPARVTLTVDDPGMTVGADTYYANTALPVADAAKVPVGVAITVGYPLAQTRLPAFQSWVSAGRDVTSHSMSHTYYTNLDALDIRYTGTGMSATLSVGNKVLTITVGGANDSVSYNLAQGQPQGTIAGLEAALTATGHFTATENPTCQGPYGTGCSYYTKEALLSQDLADVSSVDVKSSVYAMQLDVTRLTTDEIALSRQWMTNNLTGLPTTAVYVYPGGYETPTMQGIAAGVPYAGGRGALKEDLGVKDTYASGFDVQNITSFGVNPSWAGIAPTSLNQKVQAMVWKQMVWGVPWGIFWHNNELTATEITNLIADLQNSGATILSNAGLVDWLLGGTLETGTSRNFYYKSSATNPYSASGSVDFRPTENSPVVDAGLKLDDAYAIDINGVNQNSYGKWDIGAHAYVAYSAYGQGNAAPGTHFMIGGSGGSGAINYADNDAYCPNGAATFGVSDGPAMLPANCYSTDLSNPANASPLGQVQGDIPNGASAATVQAVLNNAQCGEVIKFAEGATVSLATGAVTIPNKGCRDGHYIQITVDTAHLPSEGQRTTPCWWGVASLPGRPPFGNSSQGGTPCTNYGATIINTGGGNGAFTFATGATHYRFGPGLHFQNQKTGGGNTTYVQYLPQTDHIIYDRDWFGGDPNNENQHGIGLVNSNHVAWIDSFFTNFFCTDISACDAQAILGGACTDATCGVYKSVNNYMEGAGETYMFGGVASTNPPADVEIRRNWDNTPQIWNPASLTYNGGIGTLATVGTGVNASMSGSTATFTGSFSNITGPATGSVTGSGFSNSGYNIVWHVLTINSTTITATATGVSGLSNATGGTLTVGHKYMVKNLGELKNANRVLSEGNVRTNSWCAVDQAGFAILLTPKAYDSNPAHYAVNNVTARWERFDTVGSGFQIANVVGDTGLVASSGGSYSLHDILGTNIGDSSLWNCVNFSGAEFQLSSDAAGHASSFTLGKISVHNITLIKSPTATTRPFSFLIGGPGAAVNPPQMSNFTFENNLFFDMGTGAMGGYAHTLKSIQRVCNNPPSCTDATVTAILTSNARSSGYYAIGGNVGVTGVGVGVSGDTSFNCGATFPCALGTNFTVTSFNGTDTLQWKQAGADSGPWTTTGGNLGNANVSFCGCDYNNTTPPGILTGCFSGLTFDRNVIYSTIAPTRSWPGRYFNAATSGAGFTNYTGDSTGTYKLLNTSPYHNAGSDGKDMGVSDIDKLMQMTAGVDTLQ
jgi:hypothetical protein